MMSLLIEKLGLLRGRKKKAAKYLTKEAGITLEVMSKKDAAKLGLSQITNDQARENSEISLSESASVSAQEFLPGFTKKLIQVLKSSRYFYFIRYEKNSKSIIIPSKKDFTTYVLNCQDDPIFKAASFSVFHRQMRLRGFEVIEALIRKTPGRLDNGIGYKASNNPGFIKAIKEK